MTLGDLSYLASEEGRRLLAEVSAGARELSAGESLALQTRLRRTFPADRVRLAVEQAALRRRASEKFARAADMLFDREALEQATGEIAARHHACRYRGFEHVADVCCGVGGDAIALAGVTEVVAVDVHPGRAALARWNAEVHGRRVRAVCADAGAWLPAADALWLDPSRRTGGRRRIALADCAPAVDPVRWARVTPHFAVKVAPGLPHADIPDGCEAEFVSVHGECRELVLWFGSLRSGCPIRATLLPEGRSLEAATVDPAPVGPVEDFVYEPDRAVIRAHLIDRLARDLGASKLAPDVAYLTTARATDTPFARRFRVREVLPFGLRRLKNWCRDHGIGRLDIKKRHFPMSPEEVRTALRLQGDGAATLILTRIEGRPVGIFCDPCSGAS